MRCGCGVYKVLFLYDKQEFKLSAGLLPWLLGVQCIYLLQSVQTLQTDDTVSWWGLDPFWVRRVRRLVGFPVGGLLTGRVAVAHRSPARTCPHMPAHARTCPHIRRSQRGAGTLAAVRATRHTRAPTGRSGRCVQVWSRLEVAGPGPGLAQTPWRRELTCCFQLIILGIS